MRGNAHKFYSLLRIDSKLKVIECKKFCVMWMRNVFRKVRCKWILWIPDSKALLHTCQCTHRSTLAQTLFLIRSQCVCATVEAIEWTKKKLYTHSYSLFFFFFLFSFVCRFAASHETRAVHTHTRSHVVDISENDVDRFLCKPSEKWDIYTRGHWNFIISDRFIWAKIVIQSDLHIGHSRCEWARFSIWQM